MEDDKKFTSTTADDKAWITFASAALTRGELVSTAAVIADRMLEELRSRRTKPTFSREWETFGADRAKDSKGT